MKGQKSDIREAPNPGRMTRHPEVTLGSLGEFETCPDWVPILDKRRRFARIALKTMGDQRVRSEGQLRLQKFETCPDWGARFQFPKLALSD